MLGELARIQHRFDDAVDHIGRAAEMSRQLGFQQTEAYQLSSLGRAQCQAGDYQAGSATLNWQSTRPRPPVTSEWPRSPGFTSAGPRALGQIPEARTALEAAAAWHRTAGGGEQAARRMPARRNGRRRSGTDAEERLIAILDDARLDGDAHVEVFALDALARIAADTGDIATARDLCATADRRLEAASDFITDFDRTDAHSVRQTT